MANKIAYSLLPIENKEVTFIKPSQPTPSTILSLSSIDNDPENNIFQEAIHVFRSANHTPKLDPACVIKEALSKALIYYYPLAGKLVRHGADGKLAVNCNCDGLPFIEAVSSCSLSSLNYLDSDDFEMTKQFELDFPRQDQHGNQYPLVFKVTKFACGGFTIVTGLSHAIFDGSGLSQFLRAVAELASGKSEPSVKAVWERERLVGTLIPQPLQNPLHHSSAAVSPFLPTSDFVHQCFTVESKSITRLKTILSFTINNQYEEMMMTRFTTFESLAAYIWRARTRALNLNYEGKTMLIIIVGMRGRLRDPLPEGYYGNNIMEAFVVLSVKELKETPLVEIAKLIRKSLKVAFTDNYITHFINSTETKPKKFNYEGGAITTITDWRHLSFFENVDFGWKEAVNTIPVPCDMIYGSSGMCNILAPSKLDPSMSTGVRVYLSLPRAAMAEFKQEMQALRSISNM